jgi:hypothetical protein
MTDVSGGAPARVPAAGNGPVDWRAILTGALVGLAVIVPTLVLRAVLDRAVTDFDGSGWIYPLFALLLIGYLGAGWVAGRRGPEDAPLTHGTLAGVAVLAIWLPVRVLIWAVHDEGRGLFGGHDAALPPGQIFGHLLIAAALGMLGAGAGGVVARRRARAR